MTTLTSDAACFKSETLSDVIIVMYPAYMEIGTINATAIIGRYTTNVAMSTNKFQVPYFVTSTHDSDPVNLFNRFNVVTVLPAEYQLQTVTYDLIRALRWSSVVLFYSASQGILCTSFF